MHAVNKGINSEVHILLLILSLCRDKRHSGQVKCLAGHQDTSAEISMIDRYVQIQDS